MWFVAMRQRGGWWVWMATFRLRLDAEHLAGRIAGATHVGNFENGECTRYTGHFEEKD